MAAMAAVMVMASPAQAFAQAGPGAACAYTAAVPGQEVGPTGATMKPSNMKNCPAGQNYAALQMQMTSQAPAAAQTQAPAVIQSVTEPAPENFCQPAPELHPNTPMTQYDTVRMEISGAEEQAAAIDRRLEREALTQVEMNQLSMQKYQLWDNELNSVWGRLQNTLSAEEMNRLTADERTWINQKDAAMANEAAKYGSGSLSDMMRTEKGVELTKARVYVLAEYLHR